MQCRRGIGRAIATRLTSEDANVVVTGVSRRIAIYEVPLEAVSHRSPE